MLKYSSPNDIESAVKALAEERGQKIVVAGGTDIVPEIAKYTDRSGIILDLTNLSELRGIVVDDRFVRIGAMTILQEIAESKPLLENAPILSDAAHSIGCRPIRNKATIGGNIVRSSPAGDMNAALIATGAMLEVKSLQGTRHISIDDFFLGPEQNSLHHDELLTEVVVEKNEALKNSSYFKYGNRAAMTCTVVSAAICLNIERGDSNLIKDVRIGLGAVAPTPVRAFSVETALTGTAWHLSTLRETTQLAKQDIMPIDDIRASAWYRTTITPVILERALLKASGFSDY
jgi:carbon-monoxide dehydrogenase medium subunit